MENKEEIKALCKKHGVSVSAFNKCLNTVPEFKTAYQAGQVDKLIHLVKEAHRTGVAVLMTTEVEETYDAKGCLKEKKTQITLEKTKPCTKARNTTK